ncbi:hypothetical protein CHQ57_06205 [Aeromonas salmonicida]|nr:hypothetical protein CHQ57_06205 [Aeromonas salmonicida]
MASIKQRQGNPPGRRGALRLSNWDTDFQIGTPTFLLAKHAVLPLLSVNLPAEFARLRAFLVG